MAIGTGINRLIVVTQAKMQDANDEAAQGANQARDLMARKKIIRKAKRDLEADNADGNIDNYAQMRSNYYEAVGADASIDGEWSTKNLKTGKYWYTDGKKFGTSGDSKAHKENKELVEKLISAYEGAHEDLDSQEKLGNMEIQDLMSRYNQAEQLPGSTFKKKDDADLAIVNKI